MISISTVEFRYYVFNLILVTKVVEIHQHLINL